MSISVIELMSWLESLGENDFVGIDEGGLTLQSEDDPEAYLEIGGVSE